MINYWEENDLKKDAMKYFFDFFETDLNFSKEKTLNDLEEKYLEYCKEYFTKFDSQSILIRKKIQASYKYIKRILNEQTKVEMNKEITKQLVSSYEELIASLSQYHFLAHFQNSYGAMQNKINKDILLEISLLKPIFTKILENIDAFFSNTTEIDLFYVQIVEEIKNLILRLKDAKETFEEAGKIYHHTWNTTMRPEWSSQDEWTSCKELGKEKKHWRLQRNKVCYTVLYVYRELENLNKEIYYSRFDPEHETSEYQNSLYIQKLYMEGMAYIRKSPNYYCYLSHEEKNALKQ